MAAVTAAVAVLAFLAGCVTFVQGMRAGYGTSSLATHLNWGALTLVLQLFAAGIALVHARAGAARAARPEGGASGDDAREDRPPPAA